MLKKAPRSLFSYKQYREYLRQQFLKGRGYQNLVDEVKILILQEALEKTHDNYSRAAKVLGLHRSTMMRLIEKYGIFVKTKDRASLEEIYAQINRNKKL